jgi:hypothetical protein
VSGLRKCWISVLMVSSRDSEQNDSDSEALAARRRINQKGLGPSVQTHVNRFSKPWPPNERKRRNLVELLRLAKRSETLAPRMPSVLQPSLCLPGHRPLLPELLTTSASHETACTFSLALGILRSKDRRRPLACFFCLPFLGAQYRYGIIVSERHGLARE